MREIDLRRRPVGALSQLLPAPQAEQLEKAATNAGRELAGRTIWNVSSTATGGGVAEMLHNLLGLFLDAGVRTRWLVVDADARFFATTKHIHNAIHGAGDYEFTAADHDHYQRVLAGNMARFRELLAPSDIVLLHDPQTAGLVPDLGGNSVAWRSHIGRDTPNGASEAGWEFLRRYLEPADAFVFSRPEYAPPWIPADKLRIIPPSIDPLSAKNRALRADERERLVAAVGLPPSHRFVLQVSRWDRLKDMPGVMAGFRRADTSPDMHLVLAGPAVAGVTDDPEGAEVFAQCQLIRAQLPSGIRERVHLVSIPMNDITANALTVNALQRQATVVVQKSLAEGFGLTVAEAMWKGKPVIASAVGGIQDQISSQRTGFLVHDPADPDEFAAVLREVLADPAQAARVGQAAHDRVRDYYLDDRQLTQLAALFESQAQHPAPQPA